MKVRLKGAVLRALSLGARWTRGATTEFSALVCPSAAPGSIGDAAMITALVDRLKQCGFTRVGVVEFKGGAWRSSVDVDTAIPMPERSVLEWIKFSYHLRRYSHVFVIGADCIDGLYSASLSERLLGIVDFAARAGCVSTLCGASFNAAPSPIAIGALKRVSKSARLLARDPRSLQRMRQHGARQAEGVADLAFLLMPDDTLVPDTCRWVGEQRQSGKQIFGVNIATTCFAGHNGELPSRMAERFSGALGELRYVMMLRRSCIELRVSCRRERDQR